MAVPRGNILTDGDELLYRAIPPAFIENGRPSSKAFTPHKVDQKLLSVAQQSKTSAQAVYEARINAGRKAKGTWAVSVKECKDQQLDAYDDPDPEVEGHGVIDYRPYNDDEVIEDKAAILARKAHDRTCQYAPPPLPSTTT